MEYNDTCANEQSTIVKGVNVIEIEGINRVEVWMSEESSATAHLRRPKSCRQVYQSARRKVVHG